MVLLGSELGQLVNVRNRKKIYDDESHVLKIGSSTVLFATCLFINYHSYQRCLVFNMICSNLIQVCELQ